MMNNWYEYDSRGSSKSKDGPCPFNWRIWFHLFLDFPIWILWVFIVFDLWYSQLELGIRMSNWSLFALFVVVGNQRKIDWCWRTMYFRFTISNLLYFFLMLKDLVLSVDLIHEIVLLVTMVHDFFDIEYFTVYNINEFLILSWA